MSLFVIGTRDFEHLYAHIIPKTITGITFVGVPVDLLTINRMLTLVTCLPIPAISFYGMIFVKKISSFSVFPPKDE